ncbi:single-stranded DNA-binding protein [Lactiplantibacillus mudanjiangensis]|uniref:Single-stranded DNA-binding protein n=1 Tax=Lactiplantibacillus mudanjiangensis TaxID=1296538 RepID=A0A660DZP0_9LACO|nr:single-stranded DNA-binding protein [Lactiplantibacillus mudanjiangensis]VDG25841.1 single-stranded DNA-binding protein [Lactobacillus pentosus] [Lactiplantibacillus mudanjiangensis]VDG28878.1 single-stranded DNA-binding protein [Lactobacillus pentosus] [Lactiplantibacillus mudanjiangensis]
MRQITISGNVGKEPVLNTTQSGKQVANFSVAVRQDRPDNNGEYGTDWFRCSVWGKRAGTIGNYYHKGSHVTITGSFELGEYNGNPQLGVNVTDFDLPDNSNNQSSNRQNNGPQQQNNSQGSTRSYPTNGKDIDISDDDLPF